MLKTPQLYLIYSKSPMAATNCGVVYTTKGFGGILGGVVAGYLVVNFGWTTISMSAGGFAVLARLGALILKVLPKPLCTKFRNACPVCEVSEQKAR